MKHFNFKPDAQFIKLSLVGSLLACLGSVVSFNPETQVIARNESMVTGTISLASTTANPDGAVKKLKASGGKGAKAKQAKKTEPTAAEPKADPAKEEKAADTTAEPVKGEKAKTEDSSVNQSVKLSLDNGIKVNAEYDKASKIVYYEFECKECGLDKDVISISDMNFSNLEALKLAIKKDALNRIALAEKDIKKAKEKEKDETPLYVSTCTEEEGDDIAGLISCQTDELKKLMDDCKTKEREHRDESVLASRRKDGKSLKEIAKNKVSCEKLVKSYYKNEVRPVIEMGLKISPYANPHAHNAALSGITMILGGKIVPDRYITPEMALDLNILTRTADASLVRQQYDTVKNLWVNSITSCQLLRSQANNLPSSNCGTLADAEKNASLAASAFLSNLQFASPFSDGNVLSAASQNIRNLTGNELFVSQYQSEYQNPMTTLSSLLVGGKNLNTAQSLLAAYSNPGVSSNGIVINPDGSVTIRAQATQPALPGQSSLPVVTQPNTIDQRLLDPNLLQGRNGRNGLNIGAIQIPNFPVFNNNPAQPNPVQTNQPLQRSAFQ